MNKIICLSILYVSVLTGCQVVSVKNQAINVTISNERESILTRDKLSEARSQCPLHDRQRSQKLFWKTGWMCFIIKRNPTDSGWTAAFNCQVELYLSKALLLEKSSNCKISILTKHQSAEKQQIQQQLYNDCLDQSLTMPDKSIRYSYAYMFKTRRAPQDRIFDNRQVQIRDFYNAAIAKLGFHLYLPL